MAEATYHSATSFFARITNAVLNALIYINESNITARQFRAVAEMSDADLKAKGLTRETAMQNIVADLRFL